MEFASGGSVVSARRQLSLLRKPIPRMPDEDTHQNFTIPEQARIVRTTPIMVREFIVQAGNRHFPNWLASRRLQFVSDVSQDSSRGTGDRAMGTPQSLGRTSPT